MDMLRITNLHNRFGYKEVLRGLNLTVPEHSIYGFAIETMSELDAESSYTLCTKVNEFKE